MRLIAKKCVNIATDILLSEFYGLCMNNVLRWRGHLTLCGDVYSIVFDLVSISIYNPNLHFK